MEKKKDKKSIVIIVLLLIVIVLLGVLIITNKEKIFQTNINTNKNDNYKENIVEEREPKEITIEEAEYKEPENMPQQEEIKNSEADTSVQNGTYAPQRKYTFMINGKQVTVDLDKCLNNPDPKAIYSNPKTNTASSNGLSIRKTSDHTASITIDYGRYEYLCSEFTVCNEHNQNEIKNYDIVIASESINDYIIGGRGQDFTSTTFFYLTKEIGSAHCAKLYKKVDGKYIMRENLRPSYVLGHDMIALFNVDVGYGPLGATSHSTTIGVLEDGSFYDLGLWLDSLINSGFTSPLE